MFTSAGSSTALIGPQSENSGIGRLFDPSSVQRTSAGQQASSFAWELAEAIEQYLGRTDSGAHLQIEIRPSQSHNSGARQFLVTVMDQTAVAAPASAGAAETAISGPAVTTPMVGRPLLPETLPWVNPTPAKPAMPYANSREAYWAAQPPEVQEMRLIPEGGAREAKSFELARRGFTIDYPIMVWDWDPLSTMRARINAGYTWIPAVGQPSIEVTAGATFPGRRTYDPSSPPPGSIPVNMDFAKGYES